MADLKLYLWHSQILPVQAYHACIIVVNQTTTVKASRQGAGSQLAQKLCAHLRPKCHPLLLDASINSPATVRLNLYQVRLLLLFLSQVSIDSPILCWLASQCLPALPGSRCKKPETSSTTNNNKNHQHGFCLHPPLVTHSLGFMGHL